MSTLAVAPVSNPTLSGVSVANPAGNLSVAPAAPQPKINGVITATPGSNGFAGLSTPSSVAASGNSVNAAVSANNDVSSQISALMAQIAAANQKVYAPALDTSSIFTQAGANAASNVNPYYTKLLNDFVTQQGTARQQQQQQTDMNLQNLKDQLAQTVSANATTGERTTADAALTEGNINTAADQRQTDQGTQFNTARNAEAARIASSGLTGSGLAAGTQATSQATHDINESRQAEEDQHAKDAAELSKARTFEDLATSNTNATSAEGKGETQANFDLNKFITGQTGDLQNEQQDLEAKRQSALASERETQTKILVNNFINSIANPAQRQAAIAAYGGL